MGSRTMLSSSNEGLPRELPLPLRLRVSRESLSERLDLSAASTPRTPPAKGVLRDYHASAPLLDTGSAMRIEQVIPTSHPRLHQLGCRYSDKTLNELHEIHERLAKLATSEGELRDEPLSPDDLVTTQESTTQTRRSYHTQTQSNRTPKSKRTSTRLASTSTQSTNGPVKTSTAAQTQHDSATQTAATAHVQTSPKLMQDKTEERTARRRLMQGLIGSVRKLKDEMAQSRSSMQSTVSAPAALDEERPRTLDHGWLPSKPGELIYQRDGSYLLTPQRRLETDEESLASRISFRSRSSVSRRSHRRANSVHSSCPSRAESPREYEVSRGRFPERVEPTEEDRDSVKELVAEVRKRGIPTEPYSAEKTRQYLEQKYAKYTVKSAQPYDEIQPASADYLDHPPDPEMRQPLYVISPPPQVGIPHIRDFVRHYSTEPSAPVRVRSSFREPSRRRTRSVDRYSDDLELSVDEMNRTANGLYEISRKLKRRLSREMGTFV